MGTELEGDRPGARAIRLHEVRGNANLLSLPLLAPAFNRATPLSHWVNHRGWSKCIAIRPWSQARIYTRCRSLNTDHEMPSNSPGSAASTERHRR
jgi:hypothetical protein